MEKKILSEATVLNPPVPLRTKCGTICMGTIGKKGPAPCYMSKMTPQHGQICPLTGNVTDCLEEHPEEMSALTESRIILPLPLGKESKADKLILRRLVLVQKFPYQTAPCCTNGQLLLQECGCRVHCTCNGPGNHQGAAPTTLWTKSIAIQSQG